MSETVPAPRSLTPSTEGFITVPNWTEAPKASAMSQEAHEVLVSDSMPKLGEQGMKAAGVVSPEDNDIDNQKLNVVLPRVMQEAFPDYKAPQGVALQEPVPSTDIDENARLRRITTIIAQPTEPSKKKPFWK